MRILMVLTSHDVLGNTGRKTGCCLKNSQLLTLSSAIPLSIVSSKGGNHSSIRKVCGRCT